jgi:hypothetical protein
MRMHHSEKLLGTAAVIAVVFSIGSSTFNLTSCCRQNLAKAESVLRAQRWQSWRYTFARSAFLAAGDPTT